MFEGMENVVLDGEYAYPQELGTVYARADFAWAIDLEDAACNSRWLLPNRYYEAGICGVPCLAVAGSELGTLIDRLGVGWTFAEPLEEPLVRFFEGLEQPEYEFRRLRLAAMPTSRFVADDDMAALCMRLMNAAGASHCVVPLPGEAREYDRVPEA